MILHFTFKRFDAFYMEQIPQAPSVHSIMCIFASVAAVIRSLFIFQRCVSPSYVVIVMLDFPSLIVFSFGQRLRSRCHQRVYAAVIVSTCICIGIHYSCMHIQNRISIGANWNAFVKIRSHCPNSNSHLSLTDLCLIALFTHSNRVIETKSDTLDLNVYIFCRRFVGPFSLEFSTDWISSSCLYVASIELFL